MFKIKQFARSVIPRTIWAQLSRIRGRARWAITRAGFNGGPNFIVWYSLDRLSGPIAARFKCTRRLRVKGYRYPIYYRMGTSDLDVIRQVLCCNEYECVAHEQDVSLIIDCGANIGCTSYFLLHRYSNARVVVVEPDPGNFAMCQRNLEPFADRVVLVNSAVWSTASPLRIERGSYGDGREWSFQVRAAVAGEQADLTATTISDLLDGSGVETIDLLKIDIECAERELFSKNTEKWLPRTRCVAIELHGAVSERAFFKAMAEYCPSVARSGELTICRNIASRDVVEHATSDSRNGHDPLATHRDAGAPLIGSTANAATGEG
jgi:FkbM family methyltransferase